MVTGKVGLVTGASSGIGRHLSLVLAKGGGTIYCGARHVEALDSVVAEIQDAGGMAEAVRLDVSNRDSVEAAVAHVGKSGGRIDFLINAAGIARPCSFLEMVDEDFATVVETNLVGTWRVSQVVARVMASQSSGAILNISSVAGIAAQFGQANYGASKAGVIHLTRVMALELVRYGVRVNVLAPGYFHTNLTAEFVHSTKGRRYIDGLLPGRLGELSELDGPAELLVSDAGSFVTGSVLTVDGGTVLRGL